MHPPPRQDSAKSTSVTLSTSRTPSPSTSPISPTVALSEGLSKRHSWHRGGQEIPEEHTIGHGPFLGLGLKPGVASKPTPRAKRSLSGGKNEHVMKYPEEYDLGTRAARSSSFSHPRPYFHALDSEQSLGNDDHTPEDEDDQRLAFAPPPLGAHRRQPSRAYDEQGNPRANGIGERMAVALSRNATLKSVSRSIRQASVRVVNIRPDEGRERLEDEEASTRLRGRSFGLFGPESRIRNAMADVLNYT